MEEAARCLNIEVEEETDVVNAMPDGLTSLGRKAVEEQQAKLEATTLLESHKSELRLKTEQSALLREVAAIVDILTSNPNPVSIPNPKPNPDCRRPS